MPPVSVTIFASDPGTYFLEDDGIPGNNFSRIRFPDGTVVSFEHPTDDLIFDPSVAGITLVIDLLDSLGTSNFSTGSFIDPLSTPDLIQVQNIVTTADISLISNGAIIEAGSDGAPDIVGASLILSGTLGIGSPGNPLETQVGTLEAETTTGGIALTNFGTVSIGGLTASVDGLDVLTSGDINFTNYGAIVLSDDSGPETIHGGTSSGHVTLTAKGVDSDIISNIDQDSISAPRGNIFLTAGRDIGLGLIGANFDNDVRANGSITFNSGRDILIDGFADIVSDDFGQGTGGAVVFNSGRNIGILAIAGTDGGLLASGSAGANLFLNTGPGGTLTLNSGNGTAPFASLISNSGNVTINADRISIGTLGAISTPNGSVTLNPLTPGWAINLGSVTDAAFAVELSDAELDRIFADTLFVGGNNAGPVTVSSAISPLNTPDLWIGSGTNININASMTVANLLRLSALDNISQLAASAINIGGALQVFVDSFDDDPGVGGIATFNGTITATSNVLNGNLDADTLNGTAGNNILNGNAGADTMRGLGGNDIYVVDSLGDGVIEAVGQGYDQVYALSSYALAAGVSVEALLTQDQAATTALNLSGNEQAQLVYGNAGANQLIGGGGEDILQGLAGDDIYVVDSLGDSVIEAVGQGYDQVYALSSYALAAGVSVEALLTLNQAATTALNLTGNEQAQLIYGNAGANQLIGGGGEDILQGLAGDDIYVVDSLGDGVIEAVGQGYDQVYALSSYALAAGVSVEALLTLNQAATTALNLSGNEQAQLVYGNAGANQLIGGGGEDILQGLAGNDIYVVDSLGDGVIEAVGQGYDQVYALSSYALAAGVSVEALLTQDQAATTALNLSGNEQAQLVYGNAGANVLNGAAGADILTGLAGSDTFAFSTALGGGNIDSITDMVAGVDKIALDNAIFYGFAEGPLFAGAFRSGASAQDADDNIIYNPATGALMFDADGNGAGAAIQFAVLQPGLALTAGDFFVF